MSSFVRPPQDQPTMTIEAAAGGFFGAAAEAEAGSEVLGDEDFERVDAAGAAAGQEKRLDPTMAADKSPTAEAHKARIRPSQSKPSGAEVEVHNATHCPYRSWCTICIAASAKEEPHLRHRGTDAQSGLRLISMDYELLEEQVSFLGVKDEET